MSAVAIRLTLAQAWGLQLAARRSRKRGEGILREFTEAAQWRR